MKIKPRRRLTAILAMLFGLTALSGCSTNNLFTRLGMPEPATKEGPRILSLWQGSWVAAFAVGILVWGLLIWAIVVYRRKDDSVPKQTKYNMPIEIGYTIAPLIMILGLFYFTARDQTELTKIDNGYTHTVNVQAWRWSWGFNYVDEKTYDVGTPAVVPELWLPVNEKVKFTLNSPDVIHSFWVPAFLMKMDVVPGRNNQFEVTPDRIGTFAGKCTELCGVDHSRMLFKVNVVSRADYDKHMADLKARGQIGELKNPNARIAGEQ